MKKVLVLGYFGYLTDQLDGQTVKTRDVYRLAKEQLTDCDVEYFDTQSLQKSKPLVLRCSVKLCVVKLCSICRHITSSNIKYIDNQLVTVIKIQMICKCKYKPYRKVQWTLLCMITSFSTD